jgi:hypothetical protein
LDINDLKNSILGGRMLLLEKTFSKEKILKSMEQQIDDLILQYEEQLKLIKTENSKLLEELLVLKNLVIEKDNQIQDLINRSQQKIMNENGTPKNFTITELTKIFPHYINLTEKLLKQQKYKECLKIVTRLTEVMDAKAYCKPGGENLVSLIKELLNIGFEKGSELEELFIKLLFFIRMFNKREEIQSFLLKNSNEMNKQVIKTENGTIITDLGKIYFLHNKSNDLLGDLIKQLSNRWDEWVGKMNQKDVIKLLWYDFLLNKDKQVLGLSETNEKLLDQNLAEVELYGLYRKIIAGLLNKKLVNSQIKDLKEKITLFNLEERNKMFNTLNIIDGKKSKKAKMKEDIDEISHVSIKPKKIRKIGFVVKLPTESHIMPGTGIALQEEWIELAIYKDIYLKEPIKYVKAKVLNYNEKSRVFVTEKLIQEIKKAAGKNRVDIRDFYENNQKQIQSKHLTITTTTDQPFTWPSTEVKGLNQNKEEKSNFNEESELKKLGYQITGLTREKRWRILETAVKTLGLRKVANIIAQNVKLRKGQKNGKKKFVYAITEWEYDLAKLKQNYYKNNFTWPSTN